MIGKIAFMFSAMVLVHGFVSLNSSAESIEDDLSSSKCTEASQVLHQTEYRVLSIDETSSETFVVIGTDVSYRLLLDKRSDEYAKSYQNLQKALRTGSEALISTRGHCHRIVSVALK
jgi:hypothetical protein